MKYLSTLHFLGGLCRSPCGERGLKWGWAGACALALASLPVRGAWIEMSRTTFPVKPYMRRSPCGERGLKWRALEELKEA